MPPIEPAMPPDADDRGHRPLGEHVRDGGVEVGRPGLVGGAGEADEEHRLPVADPGDEEDRQHRQREDEHAGLARAGDGSRGG